MKETMQQNSIEAELSVLPQPIKGGGKPTANPDLIARQAELGRDFLVPVDYTKIRGTCGDERERVGLLSGADTVEARPSVFGGPDIYGLGVAELTGSLADDTTTGEQRLTVVKRRLNAGGIMSGGHLQCAANGKFNSWMNVIVTSPDAVKAYGRQELHEAYDDNVMNEVIQNAGNVITSSRYEDWDESVLTHVLADESGEAMEVLADVPHEGLLVERNRVPNTTIDQTAVYQHSVIGRGTFDFDDCYADMIEDIITSGPDAVAKKKLALHAREAIIAAVANVVPNPELYEGIIK